MRITEPVEKAGYFWIPGSEALKAAGILKITDGGSIVLNLIGSFEKNVSAFLGKLNSDSSSDIDMKRIVGNIENYVS